MPEPELDALLRRHALEPAAADVAAAGRRLVEAGDGSVAALVFFGSRRSQACPDARSAYDFFVATTDDAAFYRALHARGLLRRSPRLLRALGRVLPPSQVSLHLAGEDAATRLHVKGSVLEWEALRRETGPRRRDHFCVARLFQPTSVLHAAGEELRDQVLLALGGAHRATFEWVRPSLPPVFDAQTYGRTLLGVSLAAELRPEPHGRAQALWEAQRAYLDEVYAALLRELARDGRLADAGPGRYRLAEPVTPAERRRVRRYFRRSLVRATSRWAKHVVTFEGWLDYIVGKVERHTGRPLKLTRRERRLPFIFLWPRVIRHLRARGRPGE
jgi:hypothetical protein